MTQKLNEFEESLRETKKKFKVDIKYHDERMEIEKIEDIVDDDEA